MVRVITAATGEPVSVEEQRDYMRVDSNFDDGVIGPLISTARDQAENYLRRSLMTRTLRTYLDSFPGYGLSRAPGLLGQISTQNADNFTRNLITYRDYSPTLDDFRIHLPFPPIVAIVAINYLDGSGNPQVVAAPDFVLDPDGGILQAAYGKIWPAVRNIGNAVWIDYQSGYGKAGDVPDAIRTWIKQRVAYMNENREMAAAPLDFSTISQYRFWQFS